MDEILVGIFESEHPECIKNILISKIAKASETTSDNDVIQKLLEVCFMRVGEPSKFNGDMAKLVFEKWALSHPSIALNFIQTFLLRFKLDGNYQHEFTDDLQKCFLFSQYILNVIKEQSSWSKINKDGLDSNTNKEGSDSPNLSITNRKVTDKLIQIYLETNKIDVLESISKTILVNWDAFAESLLTSSMASEVCQKSLTVLNTIQLPLQPPESFSVPRELKPIDRGHENHKVLIDQANNIAMVMGKCLQSRKELSEFVLNEMFNLLASDTGLPGICLASVLSFLPPVVIENAMLTVSKDTRIKDDNLFLVLNRLISWLQWPHVIPIGTCIIQLMKALVLLGRAEIVVKNIQLWAVEVSKYLFNAACHQEVLSVLSFMLLFYQHSPEIFHSVLNRLLLYIQCLQMSSDRNSKETAQAAVDLVSVMMYHFSGHPKKYKEAEIVLKDFCKPPTEKMKKWLAECANFRAERDDDRIQLPEKSPTQKTGLQNLGNTCFINSMTQSLYMLKNFRQEVLQRKWVQQSQPLSSNLQQLFSALLASKRIAVNPRSFVEASRPPWFNKGSQQDCSEFLKYLLDSLEEENSHSKAVWLPLHAQFTGESLVQTKCSHCGTVTSRSEAFNDLPLSFPTPNHSIPEQENTKDTPTLKGGERLRTQSNACHTKSKDGERSPDNYAKGNGGNSWIQPLEGFGKGPATLISPDVDVAEAEHPIFLEDLISHTLGPELLSGVNQFKCDACQSFRDAERQHFLTRLPKYLVLTLKRFTYNAALKRRDKIMTEVQYPLNLSLSETVCASLENEMEVSENVSHIENKQSEDISIETSEMSVDDTASDNPSLPLNSGISSDSFTQESSNNKEEIASCSSKSVRPPFVSDVTGLEQGRSSWPRVLSIESPLRPEVVKYPWKTRSTNFLLSAVVVHSGLSSDSGHYYSFCREEMDIPLTTDCSHVTKKRLLQNEAGFSEEATTLSRSPSPTQTECTLCTCKRDKPFDVDPQREDSKSKAPVARKRLSGENLCTQMKWTLFNDSHTSSQDFESISNLNSRCPNDTPYVLIYENISNDTPAFVNEVRSRMDLQEDLIALLEADDRRYAQELGAQGRRNRNRPYKATKSFRKDDDNPDQGGSSSGCGEPFGSGTNDNGGRFIF